IPIIITLSRREVGKKVLAPRELLHCLKYIAVLEFRGVNEFYIFILKLPLIRYYKGLCLGYLLLYRVFIESAKYKLNEFSAPLVSVEFYRFFHNCLVNIRLYCS